LEAPKPQNEDISQNPFFLNVLPDLQVLFDELKDSVIGDQAAFLEFVKQY